MRGQCNGSRSIPIVTDVGYRYTNPFSSPPTRENTVQIVVNQGHLAGESLAKPYAASHAPTTNVFARARARSLARGRERGSGSGRPRTGSERPASPEGF